MPPPSSKRGKSTPGQPEQHPAQLADLAPNARNPRKITDARLNALRRALREFGDLSGIVYNAQSKRVVGGHQRLRIFRRDKAAQVVITDKLPEPDKWGTVARGHVQLSDGNHFNYRVVNWDEQRETAALLAANAHGGEFVQDNVNILLTELDEAGFDLDLTGLELPQTDSDVSTSVDIKDKFEVVVECGRSSKTFTIN